MTSKLISGEYIAFRTFLFMGGKEIFRVEKSGSYSGFVLPLSHGSEVSEVQCNLKRFDLSVEYLSFEGGPATFYIHLSPKIGVDQDIFESFLHYCFSDLKLLTDQNSVITFLEQQYSKWSEFFGGSSSSKLEINRNIGLFGELWFLLDLVKNYGPHLASSWWGPFQNHNDFEFSKGVVEIKSTIVLGKNKISVNGVNQFQDSFGRNVHLLSMTFVPDQEAFSISDLISELISLKVPESEITNRISRIGHFDEIVSGSAGMKLALVSGELYSVSENFPIIKSGCIPRQVSGLNYQITLDGLPFAKYVSPVEMHLFS